MSTIGICKDPTCYAFGKQCRREGHSTETFKAAPKIEKQSESRKEENKEYRKLAKQFITAHPKCQVRGCNEPATTIHHKRGRIGELLTNKKYFMAVCLSCHQRITEDSAWAIENKYSDSRLKENV